MPPAKDPTRRVIDEIAKGTHDGHYLEIVEALAERQSRGGPDFLWRITLNGETWDAETVTVGEVRYVEMVTGKSYLEINPSKSMLQFAALVTAHYQSQGRSLAEAIGKADQITQPQALAALSVYEGNLGKDSAPTGTPSTGS